MRGQPLNKLERRHNDIPSDKDQTILMSYFGPKLSTCSKEASLPLPFFSFHSEHIAPPNIQLLQVKILLDNSKTNRYKYKRHHILRLVNCYTQGRHACKEELYQVEIDPDDER